MHMRHPSIGQRSQNKNRN